MRYTQAILPALAALLASSCLPQMQQMQQQQVQDKKEAEPTKVAENPPLYLGAVHQVYPGQNFVLLRIIGPMPSAGTTLITHPPDGSLSRLGNICVTSEKPTRNGIISADVRAGTVLSGDRVFLYRDISVHEPKEQDEEEIADTTPDVPPAPAGRPEVGDNEHPQIVSTPVASDADIPDPVIDKTGDDTTIEQSAEEKPSITLPSGSPGTAPSYLDDVPDNIKDWD